MKTSSKLRGQKWTLVKRKIQIKMNRPTKSVKVEKERAGLVE